MVRWCGGGAAVGGAAVRKRGTGDCVAWPTTHRDSGLSLAPPVAAACLQRPACSRAAPGGRPGMPRPRGLRRAGPPPPRLNPVCPMGHTASDRKHQSASRTRMGTVARVASHMWELVQQRGAHAQAIQAVRTSVGSSPSWRAKLPAVLCSSITLSTRRLSSVRQAAGGTAAAAGVGPSAVLVARGRMTSPRWEASVSRILPLGMRTVRHVSTSPGMGGWIVRISTASPETECSRSCPAAHSSILQPGPTKHREPWHQR